MVEVKDTIIEVKIVRGGLIIFVLYYARVTIMR